MFESSHSFVFFTLLSSAALLFALTALVVAIVLRAKRKRRITTKLPLVKLEPAPKRNVRRRRRRL